MIRVMIRLLWEEWKSITLILLGIFSFCIIVFFSDVLFKWKERVVIQVSKEYLNQFLEIEQSFFEFQVIESVNGKIQLIEENSNWVLKNGKKLNEFMKSELMRLCMKLNDNKFKEEQQSMKNDILILYLCMILILNGIILFMNDQSDIFILLKKESVQRLEILVLATKLIVMNLFSFIIMISCLMLRNSYDQGKGWLLYMKRYGLVESLYNSFSLFFYEKSSELFNSILLISIYSFLLCLIIYKIGKKLKNKKILVLVFFSLFLSMFLMNECMSFQNNFPQFFEFIPGLGLVLMLSKVMNFDVSLSNAIFCILVNSMFLFVCG